jgi:hypothetical protein
MRLSLAEDRREVSIFVVEERYSYAVHNEVRASDSYRYIYAQGGKDNRDNQGKNRRYKTLSHR